MTKNSDLYTIGIEAAGYEINKRNSLFAQRALKAHPARGWLTTRRTQWCVCHASVSPCERTQA